MAKIVEFTQGHVNVEKELNEDCRFIKLYKEEEVVFDTQVHFTPQQGFHLRDKSGQHIYSLSTVLQSMVVQLINIFGKHP